VWLHLKQGLCWQLPKTLEQLHFRKSLQTILPIKRFWIGTWERVAWTPGVPVPIFRIEIDASGNIRHNLSLKQILYALAIERGVAKFNRKTMAI
ncbi:MAG: hypothetical protein WCD18_13070, partial [Thermosynechococcaceae cyanobacterium]